MQNKWLCFLVASLLFAPLAPTKVLAKEYEEVTYDDLVNQLSERREQANKKNSAGPAKSHLGLGILNSWTQISRNGKSATVNPSGFSLSTGVDLNSEAMRGELEFRNFSSLGTGSQTGSLREIAGTFQFRNPLNKTWQSKFGGGLALRLLRFSDSQGLDVDDTSSMFIASGGMEARLSPAVAIGGDLSTHFPFGSATSDRSSIDLGIKLDTTF